MDFGREIFETIMVAGAIWLLMVVEREGRQKADALAGQRDAAREDAAQQRADAERCRAELVRSWRAGAAGAAPEDVELLRHVWQADIAPRMVPDLFGGPARAAIEGLVSGYVERCMRMLDERRVTSESGIDVHRFMMAVFEASSDEAEPEMMWDIERAVLRVLNAESAALLGR